MNHQIKKLAEQAGFVLWGDEEWNPGDVIDWASNYDQEMLKYTELVITEVFDSINRSSKKTGGVLNEGLLQELLTQFGLNND